MTAFQKAMQGAAQSGADATTYLSGTSQSSTAAGTSGGGTHIIPARIVPEKVWAPIDILAAVNSATTANGENLAQKLIGRNFTPDELQAIAGQMNVAQGSITQADVAGQLQAQQENIATSQAAYGAPPSATDVLSGSVSPQQVAQAIAQVGGSVMQQQVGAALTAGIESNGQLNDKNPSSTASGLFQFLTTTWASSGGTKFAPTAGQASLLQQAQIFVANSQGDNFRAWSPDLGGDYGSNVATQPKPGSKVANWISQNGASLGGGGTAPTSQPAGTYTPTKPSNSPVGPGLKQGRIDQGVDYSGKGNLYPTGAGTIEAVKTNDAGWEGGTYIALRLDHPVDAQHAVVYYAEDLTPGVQVGQHVTPGQVIGTATGGSSGIEIGWQTPGQIGVPLAQSEGATQRGRQPALVSTSPVTSQGLPPSRAPQPVARRERLPTCTSSQSWPRSLRPRASTQRITPPPTLRTRSSPDYQKTNLLRVFSQVSPR